MKGFRQLKRPTDLVPRQLCDLLLVAPTRANLHRVIVSTQEWPLADQRYSRLLYALALCSLIEGDPRVRQIFETDVRALVAERAGSIGSASLSEDQMFDQMVSLASASVAHSSMINGTLLETMLGGLERARSI